MFPEIRRTGFGLSFKALLENRRIVVCVGSGGVGKTTIAAAIAVRAAMEGRRTLVLTIDPARRLANSLGLSELGNRKTRIELPEGAGGELWGMMLDVKRTFDDLVEKIASDPEVRDRILGNHYYQQLSNAFAGSQEYMAMEKLHEVAEERDFDLIVLDTPPTKQALDFLDAPKRITELLDGKVIQWFVKPYLAAGRIGFNFVQQGAYMVFKIIERGTGYQALADLSEFFLAFDGLYDGFKRRAAAVNRLLADRETAFVIVTTPHHPAVDEASFFRDRLLASRMSLAGLVFNRVHEAPFEDDPDEVLRSSERVLNALPKYASTIDAMIELLVNIGGMARAEDKVIGEFIGAAQGLDLLSRVPALARDVHDIEGLMQVGECL